MSNDRGPGTNTPWTEAEIVELKRYMAEGTLSLQGMALKLKKTRGAISGKINRLNRLDAEQPASGRSPAIVGNRPSSVRVGTDGRRTYQAPVSAPLPVERDETGAVSLSDLASHHCRWPIGDPLSDAFRYCGKAKHAGGPYCSAHHRRAFVKPPPRSRAA